MVLFVIVFLKFISYPLPMALKMEPVRSFLTGFPLSALLPSPHSNLKTAAKVIMLKCIENYK